MQLGSGPSFALLSLSLCDREPVLLLVCPVGGAPLSPAGRSEGQVINQ